MELRGIIMPKPAKTFKELEKQIQKEVSKMKIKVPIQAELRSDGMILLNKSEEELLGIIKDVYEKSGSSDYQVKVNLSDMPSYIVPNFANLAEKLKGGGYISQIVPSLSGNYQYTITPSLLTYSDDKVIPATTKNHNTYNVGQIIAESSSVIFGDVIDSKINIDNSIREVYKKIESEGKEDKEDLKELMEKVEVVISEIKSRGVIPKSDGLMKRISGHLQKHGWFYGSVTSLIGSAVLQFVG